MTDDHAARLAKQARQDGRDADAKFYEMAAEPLELKRPNDESDQ